MGGGWGFLLPYPAVDVSGVFHAAPVRQGPVRQPESRAVCKPRDTLCPFIPTLGGGLPAALCSSSGVGGVSGDAGYALKALAGMELRCDGGNADVEFLKGVEALSPLSSYPLTALGDLGGPGFECSDWVVQNAIGFYRLVGVSCEGFEGSF